MSQFLRPDSNVTQTNFTNGFAEIDETSASEADYAYGANNSSAVLEVGLSNPGGTPGAGPCTVRYRIAKSTNGSIVSSGTGVATYCHVYQGGTLIASDGPKTPTGTWTSYSFTPDLSGVTDWNDLRLRFTCDSAAVGVVRNVAVSWAEIEVPDAAPTATPRSFGIVF